MYFLLYKKLYEKLYRNMWYIFRHGETFLNVSSDTIMGHMSGVYLTLNGAIQAYINGLKLSKLERSFDDYKIISSPLERTINTCKIIMKEIGRNDYPIIENLIKERTNGIFDGKKKNFLKNNYKKEYENLSENRWLKNDIDGYENYRSYSLKICEFIEKYKNEKNLIIVSHDATLKIMLFLLKQENPKKFVESLTENEGNNFLNINIKNNVDFNQNYFYSWDNDKRILNYVF